MNIVDTGKYVDHSEPMPMDNMTRDQLALLFATNRRVSAAVPLPFCRVDYYFDGRSFSLGELTPLPGKYWEFGASYDERLGAEMEMAQSVVTYNVSAGLYRWPLAPAVFGY